MGRQASEVVSPEQITPLVDTERLLEINRTFTARTQAYTGFVEDISSDLGPETITEENKQIARDLLKPLGQVVYGQDIVKLVEIDHPQVLRQITDLQEKLIQRHIDDTARLTKGR